MRWPATLLVGAHSSYRKLSARFGGGNSRVFRDPAGPGSYRD